MEARIARLESDVAHIRSDVAELKTDVRSLRDRMDARFDAVDSEVRRDERSSTQVRRRDEVRRHRRTKFDSKFDGVNAKIDTRDRCLGEVWALTLYIALAGALFGTLARGFGWI